MRCLLFCLVFAAVGFAQEAPGVLRGYARLPADSFAPGPSCGHALGDAPLNGRTPPFPSQPLQGVSALATGERPGTYLALSDNGFGAQENSADYLLRIYTVRPRFKTRAGGGGRLEVLGSLTLRDPDGHVPFPLVHALCCPERPLTGADFDVESLQRTPDGTLWLGDEFGPFLLHVDASGKLLEPPIPLLGPDGERLRAPQSPDLEEASALRVLNALWSHRRAHGGAGRPVFSPAHVLLADGDPQTGPAHRKQPPAGSGLRPASSELFQVKSLQAAGYRVVPYTVNDAPRMQELLALGVDGIISDDPELLYRVVAGYDADGDGEGGDLLTADGLIDAARFDAQGHRGGRNLRPENSLPAMELALDALMTTLECDTALSADGVPVISHEAYLHAMQYRRADGGAYEERDELLIRGLTVEQLQRTFVGDKLYRPKQVNDLAASPLAVQFAEAEGIHPYAIPTLEQVFRFVRFYAEHTDDPKRAANARRVRFNVETKINPRGDRDEHGRVRKQRTFSPRACAQALIRVAESAGMLERLDVQSFDLRSLLAVHEGSPTPGTILLVGDYPLPEDDGTNLQPEGGRTTPWLGGLRWPYRATRSDLKVRVQGSGGFEGMALSPDGRTLYPMLEKPLEGSEARELLVFAFDVATRSWRGVVGRYPLDPRGTAIGSFQLIGPKRGLVLERDGSQGTLDGFKRLFEVELGEPGAPLVKRPLLDLLDLRDPDRLAGGAEGDVGVGERFALPYLTIESVLLLGPKRVLIANDNNYPLTVGRHVGSGEPDDTELVELELPRSLE